MRPTSLLARGFVVAHTLAVTALHWPVGWVGLLALLCWLFAWVGAQEPQPTRSGRHRDVRAAEETALGQKLLYREGWIVERPAVALGLIALLSLLAGWTVVQWTPVEETSLEIAQVFVWAPAVLLAAGFVLSNMVNMWLVTGPILAFWLLAVVAGAASKEWDIVVRAVLGAVAVLGSLFCVDLLRGARRGLERAQSRGAGAQ